MSASQAVADASLHRAFVVVLILIVLDDRGDGLEHVFVALLHRVLQIEFWIGM